MDPVVLVLTRDENVGDKIEFSIKKDIPIRFVKKLLEAKLPYHPDVQTIEIFFDQQLQSDDVMVYSLVSDKILYDVQKEESRNIVNLSFHDNKPYKEWMSTPGSTNTIPQELTEEIIRDLAANPPQRRRFVVLCCLRNIQRLIVDRGDGEAERQIRQNGRVPFVIRLVFLKNHSLFQSLDNIIHSGIVFYVVYYTELLKKASKWIVCVCI